MPEKRPRRKAKSARRPGAPQRLREKRAAVDRSGFSRASVRPAQPVPDRLIESLLASGQLTPTALANTGKLSSRDDFVLRLARAMHAAKVAPGKIVDVIGRLGEAGPLDAGVSILRAPQAEVASQNLRRLEATAPGHHRLPVVIDVRNHSEKTLQRREAADRRRQEAERHFESAVALEESDMKAARSAYLAALEVHSGHLEARINLGRLLHLNGELALAEKIYRDTKHASALLSFNLAILLEDLNREEEAVTAYRDALALDPSLHDAHFNLSRLHERAERPQEALRHLLAYRRRARDED